MSYRSYKIQILVAVVSALACIEHVKAANPSSTVGVNVDGTEKVLTYDPFGSYVNRRTTRLDGATASATGDDFVFSATADAINRKSARSTAVGRNSTVELYDFSAGSESIPFSDLFLLKNGQLGTRTVRVIANFLLTYTHTFKKNASSTASAVTAVSIQPGAGLSFSRGAVFNRPFKSTAADGNLNKIVIPIAVGVDITRKDVGAFRRFGVDDYIHTFFSISLTESASKGASASAVLQVDPNPESRGVAGRFTYKTSSSSAPAPLDDANVGADPLPNLRIVTDSSSGGDGAAVHTPEAGTASLMLTGMMTLGFAFIARGRAICRMT